MYAPIEDRTRFAAPVAVHQRNLVILLRELLLAHDFSGASQVLSALLARGGKRSVPEIIFKVSLPFLLLVSHG